MGRRFRQCVTAAMAAGHADTAVSVDDARYSEEALFLSQTEIVAQGGRGGHITHGGDAAGESALSMLQGIICHQKVVLIFFTVGLAEPVAQVDVHIKQTWHDGGVSIILHVFLWVSGFQIGSFAYFFDLTLGVDQNSAVGDDSDAITSDDFFCAK